MERTTNKNKLMPHALRTLVAAWLVLATACHKDPMPGPTPKPEPIPTDTIPPVTPNDTIPPVTPNDTIVPTPPTPGDTLVPGGDTIVPVPGGTKEYIVDLLPGSGGWYCLPRLDSIRSWALCYDTIILFVRAPDGAWTPGSFHAARDSLSRRFNISPKVRGGWGWTPYQILPDADSTNIGVMGMIRSDSTQFANWGYGIYPQISKNNSKATQPQVYKGTMALPRNNCRGGRVRGR